MIRPRNGAPTPRSSTRVRSTEPRAPALDRPDAAIRRTSICSDPDDARISAVELPYKPHRRRGRWPKGKSGNKNGRKKGSKNKKTIIIEMMESKLGRKIPDPKKLTRYEAMMFKAIQKALGGDIRSMGFVLTEYRKAIEGSGGAAAATTEEDQQAYSALCAKIRREIEDQMRNEIRTEITSEIKK